MLTVAMTQTGSESLPRGCTAVADDQAKPRIKAKRKALAFGVALPAYLHLANNVEHPPLFVGQRWHLEVVRQKPDFPNHFNPITPVQPLAQK